MAHLRVADGDTRDDRDARGYAEAQPAKRRFRRPPGPNTNPHRPGARVGPPAAPAGRTARRMRARRCREERRACDEHRRDGRLRRNGPAEDFGPRIMVQRHHADLRILVVVGG